MAVARGLSLHMGPTDPDTLKPSAGVAVLSRRMHRVTPVADLPESLLPYVHAGRLSVHLCDTGVGFAFVAYNVYAWTASLTKQSARQKTDDMFLRILQHAEAGTAPYIVA
eukprot:2039560-Alexandrium_andersonii.AAC.1